ncbi:sulfotransferase [Octadecabacter sp.]|nr:sulfotransferase [Octadecabacter sp.]
MTRIGCFIIPRPRTGGTLLASMLNAHSQISFCYEIFPELLVAKDGTPFVVDELIARLDALSEQSPAEVIKGLVQDNFRVFAARARRSGLEPADLRVALSGFSGMSLSSDEARLEFVEALMHLQGNKEDVPVVGAKMKAAPELLIERHPDAAFLMLVRDGRDVFASRKTKGNFSRTPQETAQDWIDGLDHFERHYKGQAANAHFVIYENLVANPEVELAKVMDIMGLDFERAMLHYELSQQTLFSNAHGHLSAEQLKSGLNATSIGKWQTILSPQEVAEFEQVARPYLEEFEYL